MVRVYELHSRCSVHLILSIARTHVSQPFPFSTHTHDIVTLASSILALLYRYALRLLSFHYDI